MPVPTSPAEAPPTRLAATVVLLRDGQDAAAAEVLMLRRHAAAGFAASVWVFPGGIVDPGDAAVDPGHWFGIDPDALAARFGLPTTDVLAAHVAAVRETFEESGILLATHRDGTEPDVTADDYTTLRRRLNDRADTVDFGGFLSEHDLVLDLSGVTYWSRWITPIQEPRRYDTCFFITRVPPGATASHDAVETTEARWLTPRQALDDEAFPMIFPTVRTLEGLAELGSAARVLAHARSSDRTVESIQPHILTAEDGSYTGIILPDDERYPHEIYR